MSGDKRIFKDAASLPAEPSGYPGALVMDVEKYRPYLSELDISEDQKVELLQTLWSIMSAFVNLGFGVDSIQRAIPALGKISKQSESLVDFSGTEHPIDVRVNTHATDFNNAALEKAEKDDKA